MDLLSTKSADTMKCSKRSNDEMSSHGGDRRKTNELKHLKNMFPALDPSLIIRVLAQCQHDLQAAATALIDLGDSNCDGSSLKYRSCSRSDQISRSSPIRKIASDTFDLDAEDIEAESATTLHERSETSGNKYVDEQEHNSSGISPCARREVIVEIENSEKFLSNLQYKSELRTRKNYGPFEAATEGCPAKSQNNDPQIEDYLRKGAQTTQLKSFRSIRSPVEVKGEFVEITISDEHDSSTNRNDFSGNGSMKTEHVEIAILQEMPRFTACKSEEGRKRLISGGKGDVKSEQEDVKSEQPQLTKGAGLQPGQKGKVVDVGGMKIDIVVIPDELPIVAGRRSMDALPPRILGHPANAKPIRRHSHEGIPLRRQGSDDIFDVDAHVDIEPVAAQAGVKKNVKKEVKDADMYRPNDGQDLFEKDGVQILPSESHKPGSQPFVQYESKVCRHGSLKVHPDPLIETSSLSSVPAPPIVNKLRLPSKTLLNGLLTGAQLEICLRADAQHQLRLPGPHGRRKGFFIGDGAGVGKGRQQAGIIFANILHGRKKAVWLSVSADLIEDARRDMADIGGGRAIKFFDLREFKGDQDLKHVGQGVLFCSYSLLVSGNRRDQILDFCGEDFEGVLTFDEMHRAKNLGLEENEFDGGPKAGSKTALAVQYLQENLPLARVVYVSATGTTEPEHLACISRLGLWGDETAFPTRDGFIQQVKQSGHGAMEIVCMHMKAEGQYLSRSLSFQDASFYILKEDLTPDFIEMYDSATELWCEVIAEVSCLPTKAGRGALMWSAHQRFFAQLCMSAKINGTLLLANQALNEGKCVVIGLQSTGESIAAGDDNAAKDDELSSTVNGILRSFLVRHCEDMPSDRCQTLLDALDEMDLPYNPLDELIHKLGGTSKVAEMTGRKKRYVFAGGRWEYVARTKEDVGAADDESADSINIRERKQFQNGDKLVAIISQAASTGISIHADLRVSNQARRVHITLQLPWSAERAVQQLGRSHRSNQASAPEYKLLVSPIGGEWRFASAVANRLQSLGALTQGDRRAASGSSSLLPFSIDPKYGLKAFKFVQTFVFRGQEPYPIPESILSQYSSRQEFCAVASDAMISVGLGPKQKIAGCKLKRFLNRILGIPIQLQNVLFELFSSFMEQDIEAAKAQNTFTEGIFDIGGFSTIKHEEKLFQSPSGAVTKYYRIFTDRGCSWSEAVRLSKEQSDNFTGFYESKENSKRVVLVRKTMAYSNNHRLRRFHLVTPISGYLQFTMALSSLKEWYSKIRPTAENMRSVQTRWMDLWNSSEEACGHKNPFVKRGGPCAGAGACFEDCRRLTHHVVGGLVLPFWKEVESLLRSGEAVKVVRVQLADGGRVVGLLIPPKCVEEVKQMISKQASNQLGKAKVEPKRMAADVQDVSEIPPELLHLAQSGIWEYDPEAEDAFHQDLGADRKPAKSAMQRKKSKEELERRNSRELAGSKQADEGRESDNHVGRAGPLKRKFFFSSGVRPRRVPKGLSGSRTYSFSTSEDEEDYKGGPSGGAWAAPASELEGPAGQIAAVKTENDKLLAGAAGPSFAVKTEADKLLAGVAGASGVVKTEGDKPAAASVARRRFKAAQSRAVEAYVVIDSDDESSEALCGSGASSADTKGGGLGGSAFDDGGGDGAAAGLACISCALTRAVSLDAAMGVPICSFCRTNQDYVMGDDSSSGESGEDDNDATWPGATNSGNSIGANGC